MEPRRQQAASNTAPLTPSMMSSIGTIARGSHKRLWLVHGTIARRSHKRLRLVRENESARDAATWPEPPEDIMVEILLRLPVKSLGQFRCVRKSWNSLISSSYFVKKHLHRSATDPNLRQHRILGRDFQGHRSVLSRSLLTLVDNPSSSPPMFDNDLSFHLLSTKLIVGSCYGLICWLDGIQCFPNDRHLNLVYFNPSTKLKSKAPTFHHPWRLDGSCFTLFGFGYDHLSDTYKTVAIYCDSKADNMENKTMVKVYALSEDASWRNMQSFPAFPPHIVSYGGQCGKFVSGTLNWLATRLDGSLVVVSVDIAKETCREVLLPHDGDKYEVVQRPELWVLRDCLCFSHRLNGGDQFVLWQMKLCGAAESWTVLLNISHLDVGIDRFDCYFYPTPIFMLDNGEVLLNIRIRGDSVLYNPRHKSFKYLKFQSDISWIPATTHIESLVSPCPTRS